MKLLPCAATRKPKGSSLFIAKATLRCEYTCVYNSPENKYRIVVLYSQLGKLRCVSAYPVILYYYLLPSLSLRLLLLSVAIRCS